MVSSGTKIIPSNDSGDIFPFMSLPAEIRIMIYNAALPEEVHHIRGRSSGISPGLRAFMMIKATRTEFLSHFFSNSHFIWQDVALDLSGANDRQDLFKRYALPFITTITIYVQSIAPAAKSRSTPEDFDALLRWMRWRSVRSHLYPWHLKHLKLVMPHGLPWHPLSWRDTNLAAELYRYQTDYIHPYLLSRAHNVSGLHSLEVTFPCYPKPEAAKKFFEQCASKGLVGRIGYQQQSGGKTSWLCLENNRIEPQDH